MKFVDTSRTVLKGAQDRFNERRKERLGINTPAPTKPPPAPAPNRFRAPRDYVSPNVEDRRFERDPKPRSPVEEIKERVLREDSARESRPVPVTQPSAPAPGRAQGEVPVVALVVGAGVVGVVLYLVLR